MFFRSYSQRNCILECQSNHTLNLCNCVPYYLPKSKQIKYCGKNEKDCVEAAKSDMEVIHGNGSSCNCLPSCHATEYANVKSYAPLSLQNTNIDDTSISPDYFAANMAVVHFYFSRSKFTKELKSELYGFTEILSNIGGLLSLCLGFSFLSLVELVYFVTLRVLCNVTKQARKFQGKPKKLQAIPFLR